MSDFRPIPGYEGLYVISREGEVRSLGRDVFVKGFYHRTLPPSNVSSQLGPGGYLIIGLTNRNSKRSHPKLHVLVAKTWIPNPNHLPEVNHKDSNRANCNDWNLEWVTRAENYAHAMKYGGKSNSLGFYGVSYHQARDTYIAKVSVKGRQVRGTYCKSAEEAARQYDALVHENGLQLPLNFKA